MRSFTLALPLLPVFVAATNIVISDDDGWATAQIRQQFDVLSNAGHNVRTTVIYKQSGSFAQVNGSILVHIM